MAEHSMIVTLPSDVYDRVEALAKTQHQPIEHFLVAYLQHGLGTLNEDVELEALSHLSDDALWTIAREQMPMEAQTRLGELVNDNKQRTLNAAESVELEALLQRGDRVKLRKAEAAAILTRRGYPMTRESLQARP